MSIYGQAVQSGFKFGALMLGAESEEAIAAYNNEFQSMSSKLAASRVRTNAERNISAVNQDKILSNVQVGMQQDQAEASVRVQAAASGSTGGSVSDAINQTESNKSYQISANNRKAEQSKETLRTEIFNASMTVQNKIRTPKSTIVGDLMNAFSSVDQNDFKIAEAFSNKPDAGTLKI